MPQKATGINKNIDQSQPTYYVTKGRTIAPKIYNCFYLYQFLNLILQIQNMLLSVEVYEHDEPFFQMVTLIILFLYFPLVRFFSFLVLLYVLFNFKEL